MPSIIGTVPLSFEKQCKPRLRRGSWEDTIQSIEYWGRGKENHYSMQLYLRIKVKTFFFCFRLVRNAYTLDFVQCHSGSGSSIKVDWSSVVWDSYTVYCANAICTVHTVHICVVIFALVALLFAGWLYFEWASDTVFVMPTKKKIHLKFNRWWKETELNCAVKCILHASLEQWIVNRCRMKEKSHQQLHRSRRLFLESVDLCELNDLCKFSYLWLIRHLFCI